MGFKYVWIVILLSSQAAYAALGAAPSDFSVQNQGHKARVMAAVNGQDYRVSETTLSFGTVVREYVAGNGVVFAVSWNGPFLPDLQTLLGKHFSTMVDEGAKQSRASRSQLRVARPEVNIVSTGHMRSFEGRAWVVSAFPAGFNVQDIH